MSAKDFAADGCDQISTLQNRWYNRLIAELALDRAKFQISQPSPLLEKSDQALWTYLNVIPPTSLTFNRRVCSPNLFFDEYSLIVSRLQYSASTFARDIGVQNYQAWTAYLAQQSQQPASNQLPAMFQNWSMRNAPSVASVGTLDLSRVVLISAVQEALGPYRGPNARTADFTATYDELLETLSQSSGTFLSFDSTTTSDDVTDTWARGEQGFLDGLCAGCPNDSRFSRRFAANNVTVRARFKRYAVWTSTPGPWYNSSLLNAAYSNQTTPPRPQDPNPTWDDIFGAEGSMQCCLASLVVVDGVDATVTSDAIYSLSEQQTIRSNASRGLWPFFVPIKNSTATNMVTFDDVSGMKIETVTQPGNPLVIGANVLGIGQYLGHTVS
jgi:hypothetical protein